MHDLPLILQELYDNSASRLQGRCEVLTSYFADDRPVAVYRCARIVAAIYLILLLRKNLDIPSTTELVRSLKPCCANSFTLAG
jgi:hypothetical protein